MEICCDDNCDISIAQAMQKQLSDALADASTVKIDLSMVDRIDTAILQLFYAFDQDARAQKIDIEWHEPTTGVLDAAALIGIKEMFTSKTEH